MTAQWTKAAPLHELRLTVKDLRILEQTFYSDIGVSSGMAWENDLAEWLDRSLLRYLETGRDPAAIVAMLPGLVRILDKILTCQLCNARHYAKEEQLPGNPHGGDDHHFSEKLHVAERVAKWAGIPVEVSR
jgi:hypothetical protein